MASSNQRRCVFVGNIPYDATEEQLVQICEEVGPVVSFRLVIDRETGKPKGYGFCEYKDEETALSARRNLQGYEINGRQLRVDFAENDKTSDRGREQARGGPGMPSSVDSQKLMGGPSVPGHSSLYQPIGLHSAINAAAVAAGALGVTPVGMNQNVSTDQAAGMTNPLTLHLAKLSRSQLTDVISEVKLMATQNMESTRKLLLEKPQLAKALFQAQIMLGLVTPQMLQMVGNQQASSRFPQHSMRDSQHGQLPGVQSHTGLPPLAQTRVQSEMMPKTQGGQVPAAPQSLLAQNQMFDSQQHPMEPQIQIQRDTNNQVLQPSLPANYGISTLPSLHFPSSTSSSVRPQTQVAHISSPNLPMWSPLLQQGQVASSNHGLSRQEVAPNSVVKRSLAADDVAWARRSDTHSSTPMSIIGQSMASDFSDQFRGPSKMLRKDDASSASFPIGGSFLPDKSGPGPSNTSRLGNLPNLVNKTEEMQYSNKQTSQVAPEMESALLQQVLNLTPEQLSLLPLDQQQQVIQLQQALWQGQVRPS